MQEELWRCKFGAPTLNGSRSSDMRMNTSSTSRMEKHLMYMEEEMKKAVKLLCGTNIAKLIRDGRSFILTKQKQFLQQDSIKTLDSI